MILAERRRVPWDERLVPPLHCNDTMFRVSVNKWLGHQPSKVPTNWGGTSHHSKVTWRCRHCAHVEEVFSSVGLEKI